MPALSSLYIALVAIRSWLKFKSVSALLLSLLIDCVHALSWWEGQRSKPHRKDQMFSTHARLFRKMIGMQRPDIGQVLGFPVSCHRALCQEAETFFVTVRSMRLSQQLETRVQLAISAVQQQKHAEKFWLTDP